MPPRRYWTLDALRGLCALVVFISHCQLWAHFQPSGIIETALKRTLDVFLSGISFACWPKGANHPAVICFFVLSGFCIHHGYVGGHARAAGGVRWRDFFRRRFLRMMPVYWTAALLGFVLVAAEAARPTGDPLLILHSTASLWDLVIRFLAMTNFDPHEVIAGNMPLNTAATELLLYGLYPVFLYVCARGGWAGLGLLFIAAEIVGLRLLGSTSPYWVYNSILMYGVFWYAGALLAHLHARYGTRSCARALVVAWVVFVVLNNIPHFYGLSVIRQNAWGVVCVLAMAQCLHFESTGRLPTSFRVGFLEYIGDISYSLYAVHTPVILLGTWALVHLNARSYSLQLFTTGLAAVFVTLVVHHGIERVFYHSRSRAQEAPAIAEPQRVMARADD